MNPFVLLLLELPSAPVTTARMHFKVLTASILVGILATIHPAVGNIVEAREHAFIVSLRSNGEHFCSGAIIGPDTVLTSSHCGRSKRPNITVVAGSISSQHTDANHVYNVRGTDHPEAKLSILHLDRSIKFEHGINAIPYGHSLPKEVYMIGWGLVRKTSNNRSKYLSQMKLNAHTATLCNDRWALGLKIHEECADGDNGTGLCGGDFGAPLVSNNELIGIYERGEPCDVGKPIVYTRVYQRERQ